MPFRGGLSTPRTLSILQDPQRGDSSGDNQLARHYPTRAFFRQMPNDLLARYFRRRGLFEDVDFAGLGETRPEALFAAWLALADQDRNAMEADFWEVFDVSCEKGLWAILDVAQPVVPSRPGRAEGGPRRFDEADPYRHAVTEVRSETPAGC